MRRLVCLLLVALMACGTTIAYAETLTGTAQGFGGDVVVNIELEEHAVTGITVTGEGETPDVGGKAIEHFNATLTKQFEGRHPNFVNPTEIDAYSGATFTSNAVKAAMNQALGIESDGSEKVAKDTTSVDMEALGAWLANRTNVAAASSAAAFLPGEEHAPTDEQLTRILTTANNYMWCHMLTAPHFIVIRDPEEQQKLLGTMGVTGNGTVTVLVLADGVSDQEHHVEQYSPRTDQFGVEHYWQMYYCIYEAGEAGAMLNLAAISEGFRVRNYGAITLYNQGVKDAFPEGDGIDIWYAGGNFDVIQGENWDISRYTSSKDGTQKFDHFFYGGYTDGQMTGRTIDVEGNLTLLCAIVIGTIDETDTVSGATAVATGNGQNSNFDFWG